MTSSSILIVNDLGHTYKNSQHEVNVFSSIDFELAAGEVVSVQGDSGSGKTTLLLTCGAMLRPTEGTVLLNAKNVHHLSASQRIKLRANEIGYLFQSLELVPYLTVLDNVRLARKVGRSTAIEWLDKLGMGSRLDHKPEALSHGQRQRVALARAIAHRPGLVIADEPTGNLDAKNSKMVFDTLRTFADQGGAVIVASHSPAVNDIADQTIELNQRTPSEAA